eukprot:762789-Hanusia_phi.AAC.1
MMQVNLPNKSNKDALKEYSQLLWESIPDVDICLHWSVKNQKRKTAEETHRSFVSDVSNPSAGVKSILVVSGSVSSPSLDSITCLKKLANSGQAHAEIGVAFNPYFPDERERGREQQRFKDKLSTGRISHVWLQFGSDVALLTEGLKFLDSLRSLSPSPFQVFGSFFVPSKKFLAQVCFPAPWTCGSSMT